MIGADEHTQNKQTDNKYNKEQYVTGILWKRKKESLPMIGDRSVGLMKKKRSQSSSSNERERIRENEGRKRNTCVFIRVLIG